MAFKARSLLIIATRTFTTHFAHCHPPSHSFFPMHNDRVTVDELILEIADYKSNCQEVAVETLRRLCSQSYEAYNYLEDRVHDACLSERARRHVRDVLQTVLMRLHAFQECGETYREA